MADMGDTSWLGRFGRTQGRLIAMACVAVSLGVACPLPCMASGVEGKPAGVETADSERAQTGDLRITAGITNGTAKAREANSFRMAVDLSGEVGATNPTKKLDSDSITVRINGEERTEIRTDSTGRMTFDLSDGDEALIEGIPEGTRYSVTEEAPDWFVQHPSDTFGEIHGRQVAEAMFENTYVIEGKAHIEATLIVLGKEDAIGGIRDGLSFRLTDEEGNLVATARSDMDGNIRFPDMTFGASADGKAYKYAVTEDIDGQADVICDATEFPVVIMAEDSEGHGVMDVGVAYTPASGIVFQNLTSIDVPEPEQAGSGTALLAIVSMGLVTFILVDMAQTTRNPRG